MAHSSKWLLDKRIMLIEYDGDVSKAEVKQLNEDLEQFLAEGVAPVHLISDASKMGKADISIQLAREAFSAMKKPGWGWVVFVGLGRLVRFFAEVFATQFGIKIKLVGTMDEALALLKKVDASLENEKIG